MEMEDKNMSMDHPEAPDTSAFETLAAAYATFAATQWTDARYKRTLSGSKRLQASHTQLDARRELNQAIDALATQQAESHDSKEEELGYPPLSLPLHTELTGPATYVLLEAVSAEQAIRARTAEDVSQSLLERGVIQAVQTDEGTRLGVQLGDAFIALAKPHHTADALFENARLLLSQAIRERSDRTVLEALKAAQTAIHKLSDAHSQQLETAQRAKWDAAGSVVHHHISCQHIQILASAIQKAQDNGYITHRHGERLVRALHELQTQYSMNHITPQAFDAKLASLCRQLMYGGAKAFFSMRLHIHLAGHDLGTNLLKTLNDKVRQLVDKVPGIDIEDARSRLQGIKQLQGEDLEALIQAQRGVLDQATYGLMKLMMLALTAVLVVGVGVAALAKTATQVAGYSLVAVAASLYALPKLWKGFFNGIAAGFYLLNVPLQLTKLKRSYIALLGMSIVQSAVLAVGCSAHLVGRLGVFVDAGFEQISQLVQKQVAQHDEEAAQRIHDFGRKLDAIDLFKHGSNLTQQTQVLLGALGHTAIGSVGGVLAAGCAALAGLGQMIGAGIQYGMHEEVGQYLQDACQSARQLIGEQFDRMTRILRRDPKKLVSQLQQNIKRVLRQEAPQRQYEPEVLYKVSRHSQ